MLVDRGKEQIATWLDFAYPVTTMLRLFAQSGLRALRLLGGVLWPFDAAWPRSIRGTLVLVLFLPFLIVSQLIHWLGFLVDEIVFRAYRKIEIRSPVFVLGVPRSGTTHLHTTLSDDPQYTTFTAWECFFGLSITARKFIRLTARIDRRVGRPCERLLDFIQRKLFSALDDIHPLRLDAAEEDYFAFTPILASFILVVPFPFADWIWRMGYFDRDMQPADRKRVISYYRRCIQKHLYVHGPEKRFLSKNASFAGMAGTLLEAFPDGRFLVCVRDPNETIPSQLSSLDDAIRVFGYSRSSENLNARLVDLLNYYYQNLGDVIAAHPERTCVVTRDALKSQLAESVRDAYARLAIPMTYEFNVLLGQRNERSRTFKSAHSYTLDRFGLSQPGITARFGPVFDRLNELAARKPKALNAD